MTKTNIDLSNLGCIGILVVIIVAAVLWALSTALFGSLCWLAWSGLAHVVGWPSIDYVAFLAGSALVSLALGFVKAALT